MKTNKWYVGCLNDAPFIIDTPPRPSTDDCVHDRKDGPGFVVRVHGLRDQDIQDIITEHNRVVEILADIKQDLEQLEPEMKKEWDIAGFFCPWNDLIRAIPEDLRMKGYGESPMEFIAMLTDQRDEAIRNASLEPWHETQEKEELLKAIGMLLDATDGVADCGTHHTGFWMSGELSDARANASALLAKHLSEESQ